MIIINILQKTNLYKLDTDLHGTHQLNTFIAELFGGFKKLYDNKILEGFEGFIWNLQIQSILL